MPLKDIYKDKFLSGTDREILLWHFNAVTPENMMKPDAMQLVEGSFTFDDADAMIAFTQENGIATVGHTLAWHSQTPDWMTKECTRDDYIELAFRFAHEADPNAHDQDSVEIFVDENNGKTGYYEEDDGQFRVSCKNEVMFGSNGTREGIGPWVLICR